MSYELPADIRNRVNGWLDLGVYQSEDDVIREAMDALDLVEQDKRTRWHERNRLAAEQSAQGLSRPLDDQKVLERLRERLTKDVLDIAL
jgi:Arc/MetJ-type ribon-helix-helix transcriptional regulator